MVDGRVYPVRNPELVAEIQRQYSAKIERNKAAGLAAFQSGQYKPFLGWSQSAQELVFAFVAEFDQESKKRVIQRVVDPLKRLALIHDIPAIFSGYDDLPPHATLQVGNMKDVSLEQANDLYSWLFSHESRLDVITNILKGLSFHHDTLVLAPNSYICASEFGDEQGAVFKSRRIIERMMRLALREVGLRGSEQVKIAFAPPYSYYDIFHSSVLRLVAKAPSENLTTFASEAYDTIGGDIRQNPVLVTVGSIPPGSSAVFMRTHTPHLLLP